MDRRKYSRRTRSTLENGMFTATQVAAELIPGAVPTLWTDPGIKSGISVGELISTSKKKKKAQAGNEWSNILPKSSRAEEKSHRTIRRELKTVTYANHLPKKSGVLIL